VSLCHAAIHCMDNDVLSNPIPGDVLEEARCENICTPPRESGQ
jgi:hypothetical protein